MSRKICRLGSRLAALCIGLMLSASVTQAAVLLNYRSAGGFSIDATDVDPSLTGNALTAGVGLTSVNPSVFGTFNFSDWDPASTSFEDAVAVNDFWTWGFSVNAGPNLVTLETMDIRLDRSTTGPDDFEIRGAVNGGTEISLLTHDFNRFSNPVNFFNIDLTGLGTLSEGDNVNFTLAAYNSTVFNGSFDMENFANGSPGLAINGTVTAVPEPSAMAALGMLVVGGLVVRYRRKKAGPRRA